MFFVERSLFEIQNRSKDPILTSNTPLSFSHFSKTRCWLTKALYVIEFFFSLFPTSFIYEKLPKSALYSFYFFTHILPSSKRSESVEIKFIGFTLLKNHLKINAYAYKSIMYERKKAVRYCIAWNCVVRKIFKKHNFWHSIC